MLAHLTNFVRIWSISQMRVHGQMRAQFTKRCAFCQMPRVWPNAQIGQLRLTMALLHLDSARE